MILHMATFVWSDAAEPQDLLGLDVALAEVAASIPEVRYYRAGSNLGLRDNGADFGVVAVVDDVTGLSAYLDSSAHVELVARRIAPYLESRQALQLPFDVADLERLTSAAP